MRCEAVDIRYGKGDPVVRGVTLALTPGVWAVVGPNGAGKSTLLRTLAGLHAPSAGRITLGERDIHAMPARERAARVAYVPQRSSVWSGFDVRTIVAMGRHALTRDDDAVMRALERVDLSTRAGEQYRALSVGQQQRVTVARALAQLEGAPGGVLVADEPLSAQDPAHASRVVRLLREHAQGGGTVIAALHDCTTALRHADGGVLLGGDGTLVRSGPASETFTPEWLERVFDVRFDRVETPGGPALLAREARDPTPAGPIG